MLLNYRLFLFAKTFELLCNYEESTIFCCNEHFYTFKPPFVQWNLRTHTPDEVAKQSIPLKRSDKGLREKQALDSSKSKTECNDRPMISGEILRNDGKVYRIRRYPEEDKSERWPRGSDQENRRGSNQLKDTVGFRLKSLSKKMKSATTLFSSSQSKSPDDNTIMPSKERLTRSKSVDIGASAVAPNTICSDYSRNIRSKHQHKNSNSIGMRVVFEDVLCNKGVHFCLYVNFSNLLIKKIATANVI